MFLYLSDFLTDILIRPPSDLMQYVLLSQIFTSSDEYFMVGRTQISCYINITLLSHLSLYCTNCSWFRLCSYLSENVGSSSEIERCLTCSETLSLLGNVSRSSPTPSINAARGGSGRFGPEGKSFRRCRFLF